MTLGLSPSTLEVNAWENVDDKSNRKVAVAEDTCAPVFEASYGMLYGGQ